LIALAAHPEGSVVGVRAQPGARKNGIVGVHHGLLKVAVTAPADKGKANEALKNVLAEVLGVKRSHVELIAGRTSREKKFLIRGVAAAELAGKLAELLPS
jgi:uncharacterized protein (TIGR00251 family)